MKQNYTIVMIKVMVMLAMTLTEVHANSITDNGNVKNISDTVESLLGDNHNLNEYDYHRGDTYDSVVENTNLYGVGCVQLPKNIVKGKNVLTQNMISQANTCYIIQYDYDLNGNEIIIPEDCVLDFQGGSLNNGFVVLNNTRINESRGCIKVKVSGSVANRSLNASTFGVSVDSSAEYNSTTLNNVLGLRTDKDLGVGAGSYFSVILDWTGTLDIAEPLNVIYGTHLKGISASTGLRKPNNDGDIDAVIILDGGNIKVEEVRLWEGENAYGIYAKDLHRSVITNVMTSGKDIGFYFEHCWLVTINEITASACRIGFYSVGPATTFTVNRLFIQKQKEYGIYLKNHGYSTFINCANDAAEGGTAVYASNSTCTFIACGCESTNIVSNFHLVEYSRISIIGGHYHTCRTIPEGAVNPSVFTVSGSRISVDGTCFGSHYESPVPFVRVMDGPTRLLSQVTFNNIACEGTWLKNVFSNQAIGADKVINYIGHGIQSASFTNYPLLKTDLGTINFDHSEDGYIVGREFNLGNNTDGIFGKDYNSAPLHVGLISSVTTLEDNTIELKITPVRYNTYLEKNGFLLKIDNNWYRCVNEIVNIHSETHVLNLATNNVVPERLKEVFRYSAVKLSKILSINDNVISLESWNASSPKFSLEKGSRLVYFSEDQSGLIDVTNYDVRNKAITVADISSITTSSELYYLTSIENARKSNMSFKVPYLYEQNRFIAKDLAAENKYPSGQIIADGKDNFIVKGNKLQSVVSYGFDDPKFGNNGQIPEEGEQGQLFSENGQRLYHYVKGKGWLDYLGNNKDTKKFGHLKNRPESPSYGTLYFDSSNSEKPILWIYFGKWYSIVLE